MITEVIGEMLADRHEVTLRNDPLAAARLLEEERFDVLVTDYVMPGMDGVELAELAAKRSDAHCILVTGSDASGVRRSGAVASLHTKPLRWSDFISEIDSREIA